MHQLYSTLNRFRPTVPLILRVVIGSIFALHGIDKFDVGIDNIKGMFETWGVIAPGFTAPLVAVVEIVGGVALILGLGTRIAAMMLSVLMIGAIIYVKKDLGIISSQQMPGAELDLAILAGLIQVLFTGPGRYSIDDKVGLEPSEISDVRAPASAGR